MKKIKGKIELQDNKLYLCITDDPEYYDSPGWVYLVKNKKVIFMKQNYLKKDEFVLSGWSNQEYANPKLELVGWLEIHKNSLEIMEFDNREEYNQHINKLKLVEKLQK